LSGGLDRIDQISDIIANRFNKTTMTVKLSLTEILLNRLKKKMREWQLRNPARPLPIPVNTKVACEAA
jgi:hypothetical protein